MAFIHGHDGEGWHNYDMKETLQNIKWDNITKYIDINVKPGTWEVRLGDALPTPKNPIAYGLDVYNGSFNPHQVDLPSTMYRQPMAVNVRNKSEVPLLTRYSLCSIFCIIWIQVANSVLFLMSVGLSRVPGSTKTFFWHCSLPSVQTLILLLQSILPNIKLGLLGKEQCSLKIKSVLRFLLWKANY